MKKPTDHAVAEALQHTAGVEGVLSALRILLHDWRAPAGNLLGAAEILATDFTTSDKPVGDTGATLLRIIDEESRNNLKMLTALDRVATHLQRLPEVAATLRDQIGLLAIDWQAPAAILQHAAQTLTDAVSNQDQSFDQASIDLLKRVDVAGRANQQLINALEQIYVVLKQATVPSADDSPR